MGVDTARRNEAIAAHPEDAPVLEALERGDERGALGLCARQHGRAIGRLCMALLGSQAEAEDVAHEVLLDARSALLGFRGESSVRGFLLAIARRKCARQLERRGRREARLRLVHDAERQVGGEELLLLRERAERARRALDAIRPSEREAVVLRFESDLDYREIGLCLGIDEVAARKRVSRALARLREALGDG